MILANAFGVQEQSAFRSSRRSGAVGVQEQSVPPATALPPDVRQGYALPQAKNKQRGYAPGSGFAPKQIGQRPNQGHSPISIFPVTAGRSPASHQAAEPSRVVLTAPERRLFLNAEAAEPSRVVLTVPKRRLLLNADCS